MAQRGCAKTPPTGKDVGDTGATYVLFEGFSQIVGGLLPAVIVLPFVARLPPCTALPSARRLPVRNGLCDGDGAVMHDKAVALLSPPLLLRGGVDRAVWRRRRGEAVLEDKGGVQIDELG